MRLWALPRPFAAAAGRGPLGKVAWYMFCKAYRVFLYEQNTHRAENVKIRTISCLNLGNRGKKRCVLHRIVDGS